MQKKLDKNEMFETSNITNYWPHHGVFNVNKPGQVRDVHDTSAQYHRTSLNKNLLPGLDLLNNLISVLIRFQQGKMMADIKKMNHQVKVPLDETDVLRFLWRDNSAKGLSEYTMFVHFFWV